MPIILRLILAILMLMLAALCGFGFLATFEPGDNIVWRIGYGGSGLLFLAAVVWLLLPRRAIAH